jgi:heat shock protein HslJ
MSIVRCVIGAVGLVAAIAPALAGEATIDGAWRLVRVQGQAVDNGGTLLVKDGHISGSTGCNRFRASFTTADAKTIKVDPVAATKMYCQDRAMVERAYLAALETVTVFEVQGDTLVMDYQPGDKMLEFAR